MSWLTLLNKGSYLPWKLRMIALIIMPRLIDQGALEIPIARVYPLADVREAYRELEQRHTQGKIVLVP